MALDELLPEFLGENLQAECKVVLNRDEPLGRLKTVDGFANSGGGSFFIGVEDKTYRLIGFDLAGIDAEKLFFVKTLSLHFSFLPKTKMSTIPYDVRGKTRYLLRIDVPESEVKPIILKYDGMPMVFMRRDGFTSPASSEELNELCLHGVAPHFDMGHTEIAFDIGRFRDYASFYAERHDGKYPTAKDFYHAGAYDDDGYLRQGALLFMDDYHEERTLVDINIFSGLTRGEDRIVSSASFQGNLVRCCLFVYDYLRQRTNHGFVKKATSRVDIDGYPDRALFEAIVNSLAHRDYTLDGTRVSYDLFPNRLVITTPENMYEYGRVLPTRDLSAYLSKRRNKVICKLFILAKAMEGRATGFEKIVEEYRSGDLAHKPYIFSGNNQSVIVLPDLTNDIGVSIEDKDLVLSKPLPSSNVGFVRVLSFCFGQLHTVKETADHLGMQSSSYFRERLLKPLIDNGFLLEDKRGNAVAYRCNADLVSVR